MNVSEEQMDVRDFVILVFQETVCLMQVKERDRWFRTGRKMRKMDAKGMSDDHLSDHSL